MESNFICYHFIRKFLYNCSVYKIVSKLEKSQKFLRLFIWYPVLSLQKMIKNVL